MFVTVCDLKVLTQAHELWQAFYDFLRVSYREVMSQALARRHQSILDTLIDW
jgi:hypothetical protein